MSSEIDTRISKLKDFISYFAPGNIVEYGSFVQTHHFLESPISSVSNSGYESCTSKTSPYSSISSPNSPPNVENSHSSPASNPNPTPSSDKTVSSKRPRQAIGGKSLLSANSRKTSGKLYCSGKMVRPTSSGKQLAYHGYRTTSTSEDSDTDSLSASSMSIDSWDEDEVLLGSVPIEIKRAIHRKRVKNAIQVDHEEDDNIVVDDVEIEGNTSEPVQKLLRSRSGTPELGTPQLFDMVQPKYTSKATLKKQLIVRLKIVSYPQAKSLIIRLQLPKSHDLIPGHSSTLAIPDSTPSTVAEAVNNAEESLAGKNFQFRHPLSSVVCSTSVDQSCNDQQKPDSTIDTLFNHLLQFNNIELKESSYEKMTTLVSTVKRLFVKVVEQSVSDGRLGVAGLMMKLESVFIFRLLNLRSKLLSDSSARMVTESSEFQRKFLDSVEHFTEDFETITQKWTEADDFLKRETVLYTKQTIFSIFSEIPELMEFIKIQVLL